MPPTTTGKWPELQRLLLEMMYFTLLIAINKGLILLQEGVN